VDRANAGRSKRSSGSYEIGENDDLTLRTVLRSLTAVAIVLVGSLVVTAQPAAAATYQTVPVYSLITVKAGAPRAMAVLNASIGETAPLIQYTFSPSEPYNDLMVLEIEGGPDNLVRIKPRHTFSNDGNPHNDKCLAIKNNEPGYNQPIVSATCTYDRIDNDVWEIFGYISSDGWTGNLFQNRAHHTCIVVQNASLANYARLITHSCIWSGDNAVWKF
jgi:hypothetical protein